LWETGRNRGEKQKREKKKPPQRPPSFHHQHRYHNAATENDYTENRVSKKDRKGKNDQHEKQRLRPLHREEEENCSNRRLSSSCL
jgi:hypothetical protein